MEHEEKIQTMPESERLAEAANYYWQQRAAIVPKPDEPIELFYPRYDELKSRIEKMFGFDESVILATYRPNLPLLECNVLNSEGHRKLIAGEGGYFSI